MINEKTVTRIREFVKNRNWEQFHTNENLVKSIVIESAELLELYQWSSESSRTEDIKDEIADVLTYIIMLCDKNGYNMDEIINNEQSENSPLKVFYDENYNDNILLFDNMHNIYNLIISYPFKMF